MFCVQWKMIELVSIPCPAPEPDEFGRHSNYMPAINCVREEITTHSKDFTTREEAEAFIKRGKESAKYQFPQYELIDFELIVK